MKYFQSDDIPVCELKRAWNAGIKMPDIYNLGFPNANCIGCVKSQSAT